MRKILAGAVIVVAGLFFLSAPCVMAQDVCNGNFDCDQDVDGGDAAEFKSHFGRSPFGNPCPTCNDSPCPCTPQGGNCLYGLIDCGIKCVDPETDREYCGANSECLGGTVCGAGEICEGGICMLNCPPGLIECSGQCVNPDTDEQYCGAFAPNCQGGIACIAGEICAGAVCTINCPPGLTECAGTCVDTYTDENNCGLCFNPCVNGEMCVSGSCEIMSCEPPAPVEKTGQTTSYATGDDGDLEEGVAWPNPRFTDNSDGTVTDNLTGLIWLKDANCFGTRTWNNALSDANGLASGSCGLTDGSSAGDWRLPNTYELASLPDLKFWQPALSNSAGTGQWTHGDPFISLVTDGNYWSSSTSAYDTGSAWFVDMYFGVVYWGNKANVYYVWPVRGEQ
jgi:hypothetical protein